MKPLSLALLLLIPAAQDGASLKLEKGDRICVIGNNLADRMQHYPWLETLLQSRFPEHQLVIRNLGFTGDEVKTRPRSNNFGSPDDHLRHNKASVILAFFGYNEAFAGEGGLGKFRKELSEFITRTKQQNYSGKGAPRIALFSPIAVENLQSPHLPDGRESNARLALYTKAMAEVAKAAGVPFVDLFGPTQREYAKQAEPLTINGIHLNDRGYRALAGIVDGALFGGRPSGDPAEPRLKKLYDAIQDKNFHWFNRYRTVDGYNVYGGRSKLNWHGQSNADVMKREMEIFDVMTANRDKRVWAAAQGRDLAINDSNTPPLIPVKTNRPGPGPNGTYIYMGGEEAISKMKVAEGMEINLFASEEKFPELINPVQLAVDTDSRLWAVVWPTYPHWNPKKPLNDKIVILPDEDGDGKADKLTVFADGLNSVTGFEFWNGGVLVAAAPEILFLKDTDGDDRADVRVRMLQGVSSADSHHTANALTIGPDGGLYYSRGVFHVTNMETPTKTFRSGRTGVYRFDPRTFEIDFHFPVGPNPHGDVFDDYGYQFVSDGTSGTGYYVGIGRGQGAPKQWYKKRVRPVPAIGMLSSSHFPPKNDGNFLICNVIGFLGVLQHEITYDGADINATEVEPIVVSTDPNFRPSDVEVGGDGALYIADWQQALIGHMQHNIRDPNRDHTHGRIYRVTAKGRPLLNPAKMKGRPIAEVLEHFRANEGSTRYRARLELTGRSRQDIISEVGKWTEGLDPKKPADELPLLNALWVFQEQRIVNEPLLKKVFQASEPRVRAAAIRTLRDWGPKVKDGEALLLAAARDAEPLVRHEAVVTAPSFTGMGAAEAIFEAATRKTDVQLDYAINWAKRQLDIDKALRAALDANRKLSPAAQAYALQKAGIPSLLRMERTEAVCDALLYRTGVSEKDRREALKWLAAKRSTGEAAELIAALKRFEGAGTTDSFPDLAKLLVNLDAADLKKVSNDLIALTKAKSSEIRTAAYGAWMTADGSADRAWREASQSGRTLGELLSAVPAVKDSKALGSLYPLLRPLLSKVPGHLENPGSVASTASGAGVSFEYFESGYNRGVPINSFKKLKPKLKGKLKEFAHRVPKGRVDGYSLKLTASIHIPTDGTWTFFTRSDDGSRLYIDGKQVVNNDGRHGMVEKKGSMNLRAGSHAIVVTYYDNGGGDGLVVSWQGPGVKKQKIPAKALSAGGGDGGLQGAVVRAIGFIPGHESEKFGDLAGLLSRGRHRDAAIASILRIPQANWPREKAEALARQFVAVAAETPISERSSAAYKKTVELGQKLTSLLPKVEGDTLRAEMKDLDLQVVVLRAVLEQMRYDRTSFSVLAGKPVRIVFVNEDQMPHNVLVVEPDGSAVVGPMAEKMGPEGFSRHFRPDSPLILWATDLVNPGEQAVLSFRAPTKPGDYEYVCTFPGHWMLMRGIMRVVTDPADLQRPVEARMTRTWKIADLEKDIATLKGRSFQKGQAAYTRLGCAQCHKVKGKGGALGPDLSEVYKKWKFNRRDLLLQVLDPSKVVEDKYKPYHLMTRQGQHLFGLVTEKTKTHLTIVTNPQNPSPQKIALKDIEKQKIGSISLMPQGLLNLLSKEEVLDLLAFLESGGDKSYKAFR